MRLPCSQMSTKTYRPLTGVTSVLIINYATLFIEVICYGIKVDHDLFRRS